MFLWLFRSLVRSKYLSIIWFIFTPCSGGRAKSTSWQVFFFFLINNSSAFQASIRGFVCVWRSQRSLWTSFTWINSVLCIYQLVIWLNFPLMLNSWWNTDATQPYLALLPNLLIMRSLLYLFPHNLHLRFFWELWTLSFI